MLSIKFNVVLSAGVVNKTSSTLLFGRKNFIKLSDRLYFQSKNTFCSSFYPKVNDRLAKYSTTDNFITVPKTPSHSLRLISRNLSSEIVSPNFQEKADVFGDLGDKRYEEVELDEAEQKEEQFLMNEAKPSRRQVPTPGRYADMIKQHIKSGDLKAAMEVLDRVRKDRNKPTNYMYNLLIRAFSLHGNIKKCFSLYNKMKKEGLKVTLATYTSLLNACANCSNTPSALEKLAYLRQLLIEKEIPLNAVHYNAMIKAYGHHEKLFEAFQLVDEMHDKKLTIGISTFNFLLQGTISDKEAGFRHALVVWQLLRSRKLKPDIYTYNLLLRSTRDCKLGNLKIEDLLVTANPTETKMLFTSADRTNLLAHPPEVCTEMPLIGDSKDPELLSASNDQLEFNADSEESVADNGSGSGSALETTALQNTDNMMPIVELESSSPETNFLLLGGFQNFVNQMKADNVKPNIKTISYLIELVPQTLVAEKHVISFAKSAGVELDVDFYNLLIRRRSFRFDYNNALKVLKMMQQDNLEPNIMTWGVLALTCRTSEQAKELFEGMELSGHLVNVPIIGALLNQASHRWQFGLVLQLMEKMRLEGPMPTNRIYEMLESFRKKALEISKDKKAPDFVQKPHWQNGYRKFKLRYPAWLKEMQEQQEAQIEKRKQRKSL